MTTFYTSDHHFHHRGILRLVRGEFASLEDMHTVLIERWNAVVQPGDTVFHLGDFSMKDGPVAEIVAQLHGDIHLVCGNHEPCWEGRSDASKARRSLARYERMGFASVVPSGQLQHSIDGRRVLLSHLPYRGDSLLHERYEDQRPHDDGTPILCGHVHATWKQFTGHGRHYQGQVHVGVDAWDYTPVAEDAALRLLREVRPDVFGR